MSLSLLLLGAFCAEKAMRKGETSGLAAFLRGAVEGCEEAAEDRACLLLAETKRSSIYLEKI